MLEGAPEGGEKGDRGADVRNAGVAVLGAGGRGAVRGDAGEAGLIVAEGQRCEGYAGVAGQRSGGCEDMQG